jgi:PHIKZ180
MAETLDRALFNVDLMVIGPQQLPFMGEVTSLGIFENNSKVFDPKGLFSIDIFGQVGSKARLEKPGYIDLRMPILHPLVYKHVITLNKIYDPIMAGKLIARYDADIGDFVEDKSNGSTGYAYFMQYLPYLQFKNPNKSQDRGQRIALVEKYRSQEFHLDKLFVIPAGMRDYYIDAKGRPTIDEINDIYRKILIATNLLRNNAITQDNIATFDTPRYKIQNLVLDVFMYIQNLVEGKRGFMEGKWASRAIMGGTRNVLTSSTSTIKDLNDPSAAGYNHTIVGLYQYVKAAEPLAMHYIMKKFVIGAINPYSNTVRVVDAKTMETTYKTVDVKAKDAWLKREGLTSMFNKLKQDVIKNQPAKVGDDYLCLVEDTKDRIVVVKDTNNLPEGVNKKNLRPITYGELVYIAVAETVKDVRCTVTRYPITGVGSIYPSRVYLKTTDVGRRVVVHMDGRDEEVFEYPIAGRQYISSITVHSSHTGALGADFDGDSLLGCVITRRTKIVPNDIINELDSKSNINNKKEQNMPVVNKRVTYSGGLINLKDFPRGNLIKKEGNKEYYEVPEDIEILTVWNNDLKWVHPESYSIHTDLTMLNVKMIGGATLQCSNDHSIVSIDKELNYYRTNPVKGMTVPKVKNAYDKYVKPSRLKYTIQEEGIEFKLNNDLGYLFGAIIGDGWVNHMNETGVIPNPNDIMIATVHDAIANKIDNVLKSYGFENSMYTIRKEHEFDNGKYEHAKRTWKFKPVANLLRKYIGHLAINKHLPSFWCQTPIGFRWGLLSGLIDTDGTACITALGKHRIAYSTTSQTLAYEIAALISSLGMTPSVSLATRKSGTVEYGIAITIGTAKAAIGNMKLYNEKKASELEKIFNYLSTGNTITFTPNIPTEKVYELRRFLYAKKDMPLASRCSDAIKRAHPEYGCYFAKHMFTPILKAYPEFFDNDPFWAKYKALVLDENITWEVVDEVTPLPEITEAYDLTTPPYCTFVMENGIVVYDTVSFNLLYTKESIVEVDKMLVSKSYYLTPEGNFNYPAANDILNLVVKHLTD